MNVDSKWIRFMWVKRESEKAWLLVLSDGEEIWIPKSQVEAASTEYGEESTIDDIRNNGSGGKALVANWLFSKLGKAG